MSITGLQPLSMVYTMAADLSDMLCLTNFNRILVILAISRTANRHVIGMLLYFSSLIFRYGADQISLNALLLINLPGKQIDCPNEFFIFKNIAELIMHETFFDYLKKFDATPLSLKDKELLTEVLVPLKLRKRQYLLQEGNQCRHFAFVVKGAMRHYSVDDKGNEHIVQLGVGGWWMGDRESWVYFAPSRYNIDAWEDSELLLLSRENALRLLRLVPAFCEMTQQLDERNNMANQRRLTSAISATAEKRYTDFTDCYPELLQRFPQHIIASYLGITKDTLSRVKRQLMQK